MDAYTALMGLDACLGWLLGLVLIGVGVGAVRPTLPGAGYLVAAAGGVKLLVNCCAYAPTVYQEAQGYAEDLSTVFVVAGATALVLRLVSYGLLIAAAVRMATALAARAKAGGAP